MVDKSNLIKYFLQCKSKLIANLTMVFPFVHVASMELRHFYIYSCNTLFSCAFVIKFKGAVAGCRKFIQNLPNSLANLSSNHVPTIHSLVANKFYISAKYKQTWYACLSIVGCSIIMLGLLVGFVSYNEGYEIRRKVNNNLLTADSTELLKYKLNNEKIIPNSYRSLIDFDNVLGIAKFENSLGQADSMLVFSGQGVRFLDSSIEDSSIDLSGRDSSFMPVVSFDGAQDSILLAGSMPRQYGEPLDENGYPIRWSNAYSSASSKFLLTCMPFQDNNSASERILLTQAKLLPNYRSENIYVKAGRYRYYIEEAAKKYGLSKDLVYAIIYNESNFGPGSLSPRSAMGLMQLMPDTAGIDVHSFLYGYSTKLGPEQLFDPQTNINYGTAYLYLLLNRDLVQIKNKKTREYCAIASYNMGPNGFLRLFSKNRAKAIKKINSMTPQEVYLKLTTNFPIEETRNYVARVVKSRSTFRGF